MSEEDHPRWIERLDTMLARPQYMRGSLGRRCWWGEHGIESISPQYTRGSLGRRCWWREHGIESISIFESWLDDAVDIQNWPNKLAKHCIYIMRDIINGP